MPNTTQFERLPYSITSYSVNSGLTEWIKTTYSRIEIKLCKGQHLIRDLNPDFRINLDPHPDVCRIVLIMYWSHSLVGESHFAKYRTNRPVS